MQGAQMQTVAAIREFVFAGHAIFTLVSKSTGERRTFKVTRSPGEDAGRPWFVALLRGPDNAGDYSYLGCAFPTADAAHYSHGKKSRVTAENVSAKAASWFFRQLEVGAEEKLEQVEVWHEGRCCRCGRLLTTPESIASGIGPICANKEAAA